MELDDVAAESAAAARTAPRVLMCRPEHFTVAYRINPWMHPQQPTDTALALRQWQELYRTYQELGFQVDLIDPEPFAVEGRSLLAWREAAWPPRRVARGSLATTAPSAASWVPPGTA